MKLYMGFLKASILSRNFAHAASPQIIQARTINSLTSSFISLHSSQLQTLPDVWSLASQNVVLFLQHCLGLLCPCSVHTLASTSISSLTSYSTLYNISRNTFHGSEYIMLFFKSFPTLQKSRMEIPLCAIECLYGGLQLAFLPSSFHKVCT